MSQQVYVLFEIDPDRGGPLKEHPIGVVTDEAVAEAFYKADHKNRDFVMFILDEVPEFTGKPSSYTPPEPPPVPESSSSPESPKAPPPASESNKMREEIERMKRQVEQSTKDMQGVMKGWKRRSQNK